LRKVDGGCAHLGDDGRISVSRPVDLEVSGNAAAIEGGLRHPDLEAFAAQEALAAVLPKRSWPIRTDPADNLMSASKSRNQSVSMLTARQSSPASNAAASPAK
jgi:hypothetical protein